MGRQTTPDERRNVCLRTTADVLENALKQMEYCSTQWPEYLPDATEMRHSVDKIVAHARETGYVGSEV